MKLTAPLTALICLLAPALLAQSEYRNDAEVRAHINLETDLSKKWGVHLDQQYRFGNNVSQLTRASYDLGLVYKVTKHFRLFGDYVFLQRLNNDGYYSTRHWFSGAAVLRGDINRWRFVYRNMVQVRYRDRNSEQENLYRLYDRNKLSIRYEATRRFTFYTSHEAYIPLNNPRFFGVDRTRHTVGTLYNLTKNQQLEFYFQLQQQWQRGGWWTERYRSQYLNRDFIYGIGYGLAF